MASPSKRQKVGILKGHVTTSHENMDTRLKCCLYHADKKEQDETIKELEKARRLLNANHKRTTFLINDMRLQYIATIQQNASLTSRNTFLFRENSSLNDRIKTLKERVKSLSTLLGETLDESLDDLFSSQESADLT